MPPPADRRSPYIVSQTYDWAFFLLPPALSLWIGIIIAGSDFADASFHFAGTEVTAAGLIIGVIVHAHLVAVFFRSHGNTRIFRMFPYRFVLIPALLWLAIVSSAWMAAAIVVVATFWDVWHSGAQTFGFVRIYDRNNGNPAHVGRRLDFWLNQLLYAGPILAGVTLVDHIDSFDSFDSVGATFFTAVPAEVLGWQRQLTWLVIGGGSLFLVCYCLAYWRLHRQGYRFPFLKVYLLVSTGLCSIYTWGLNSWGEAFFIMNLFHAVQYLALVWAVEHRGVMSRLRLTGRRGGKLAAAGVFFGLVFAYGIAAELLDPGIESLWALTMVVSIMHFWYDGFIWSVARKQV